MKVKLYVDWQDGKIFTEKACEEEILEWAKENKDDDFAFEDFLYNYFERNFCGRKLMFFFNLNEEERKKIREEWEKHCLETAKNEFNDVYEEIEVEV